MNHYETIATVIRYLDSHHATQPDLAALADHVGLSPYHFHRLFSTWAAVTPKDFLQCLTLAHAKTLLLQGETVLDSALAAGLSGPSRLHDLCVNLEAATPGELKARGAGWIISAGYADTPFGRGLFASSPRGVCHLAFVDTANGTAHWAELEHSWPNAEIQRDDTVAAQLAARIFTPLPQQAAQSPLRAYVRGTDFQVKVWRALLQVPFGQLASYSQLAATLDTRAARAVGTAIGQNPLAYLIPCHRVIRSTGVIGKYRWGNTRKRAMLAWEQGQQAS